MAMLCDRKLKEDRNDIICKKCYFTHCELAVLKIITDKFNVYQNVTLHKIVTN